MGAIVVFPFNNRSSGDLDWIGESIAERVGEVLASAGLLVVDRDDRLQVSQRLSLNPDARLSRASMLKVAEELDATLAIMGEFHLRDAGAARSIRIQATAVDMQKMQKRFLWAEQGPLEHLGVAQNRLAWQILRQLAPSAAPRLEQFLEQNKPVRLDALENYIRGLLASSAEQKHRYLAQAARLEPGFSPALFQLGRIYFQRKDYRIAAGWLERVQSTHPNYLHAQFMLGVCRYHMADFAGAEAAFELVHRHAPLNEVINNLGAALSRRGQLERALEAFSKALEGDPADSDYHFNAGYVLWKCGRFEAAAEHFRQVLERDPADAQAKALLSRCVQQNGARKTDMKTAGLERLKLKFEERAWRELTAGFASREP